MAHVVGWGAAFLASASVTVASLLTDSDGTLFALAAMSLSAYSMLHAVEQAKND